ncbi:tryptophan--tRNA ligase [Mycoplasmopsis agassizii]|uniref:Tryptophan--tRNA ligase n=1 Tax=Mycoplasmopsis agassizii TaxID=33922 RepID=A0A269TI55_9BACT|nr:tryptophan--tRNA ligase [Mycoplasmopsis agassizii]PAK21163.1 tryptophan--tRNA ligase [Mycoplasmopsis agassizii]
MNEAIKKKIAVSGITATGNLTLGNYIGAIKNFLNYQDNSKMYIFVADLHALTGEVKPEELRNNIRNITALYLACGLDPEKVVIFKQSDVSEHALMQWLLLNQTTIGELSRMTQFKDKSQGVKIANGTSSIPTGLLIYPVLMAGDILLYNPDFVPVGIDQKQHLELTQNLAKKINNKYKTKFTIPEISLVKEGQKIMSLLSPDKKMSKSSLNKKETIFLLDKPEEARKKILSALTDSENKIYFSKDKPGVSNLLTINAVLSNRTIEELEKHFENKNYKNLKDETAEIVVNFLTIIQTKYHESLKDVDRILENGAKQAKERASFYLNQLMIKIGLKDK